MSGRREGESKHSSCSLVRNKKKDLFINLHTLGRKREKICFIQMVIALSLEVQMTEQTCRLRQIQRSWNYREYLWETLWNGSILSNVISNHEALKKDVVYLATLRTNSMKNQNWQGLWLVMRSTIVVAVNILERLTRADVYLKGRYHYFTLISISCIITSDIFSLMDIK